VSEHDKLVEAGRYWLSGKSKVVLTEIGGGVEEPDVLGYDCHIPAALLPKEIKSRQFAHSLLLECKASRSDFLNDRKKKFRMYPRTGAGEYRYYLTPPGLILPSELPENWGLLEKVSRGIRVVKVGIRFKKWNIMLECYLLRTTLQRLDISEGPGISIQKYVILDYDNPPKNTATVTVNKGEPQF
jgi:hypothetical protein